MEKKDHNILLVGKCSKSWITRPTDETGTVKAGKVQIVGVAMGGTKKVRSVKVSVDGGSSWKKRNLLDQTLVSLLGDSLF